MITAANFCGLYSAFLACNAMLVKSKLVTPRFTVATIFCKMTLTPWSPRSVRSELIPACMASSLRLCSFVCRDADTTVVVVVVVDGVAMTVEVGVVTIELMIYSAGSSSIFAVGVGSRGSSQTPWVTNCAQQLGNVYTSKSGNKFVTRRGSCLNSASRVVSTRPKSA